ncbi:MAG: hypothetical protein ACKVPX_18880 [Myxococcaceae bacterium]
MSPEPKSNATLEPSVRPPPPPKEALLRVDPEHAEISLRYLTRATPQRPLTREEITQWFEREFGLVTELTALEARAARVLLARLSPSLTLAVRHFVFQLVDVLDAQARREEEVHRLLATQAVVRRARPRDPVGEVWALIEGTHRKLGDDGVDAWLLAGGRFVAWSGLDGVGGHSLRVFDLHTNTADKLLAEEFEIVLVSSQLLSNGRWALLVDLCDSSHDAQHFAVVNPERGQTFRAKLARRQNVKEDFLTLAFFRSAELARPVSLRKPFRTQTFDMRRLIQAPPLPTTRV